MSIVEVKVPDIGDFKDVPVIEVLVKPVLRRMLGRAAVFSPVIEARLGEQIASRTGLTQFLRVQLTRAEGAWVARLTGPQGSGMLSSMTHADGLLVLPEAVEVLPQGSMVNVIRLTTSDEAQSQPGFVTRMTT